jgi:hypothetical protein
LPIVSVYSSPPTLPWPIFLICDEGVQAMLQYKPMPATLIQDFDVLSFLK